MFSTLDINVRDLFDLVVSEVDDPHEKLTQLYLWKYDYAMTAAKATTAVGASFLVGLILAMLQAKPHLASKEVVAGLGKRLDYDRGAAVEPDGDGALPE